ncbi:hypothetical protein [Aureimonas sp. SK2]|uniref:hypothetical protein n=1 Tax=Aureimonas sp. SK2 TaxID=3015992 RepID=UPI0024453477|nr:hypothetical protein [Aureimonas sp. SK2]
MNNVHRLVVPKRDETRRTSTPLTQRMGEVLILPCVRYERIETPSTWRASTGAVGHEGRLQDLTA